jgi:hypothetical protein
VKRIRWKRFFWGERNGVLDFISGAEVGEWDLSTSWYYIIPETSHFLASPWVCGLFRSEQRSFIRFSTLTLVWGRLFN